jgi:hypothetical protein
MFIPPKYLDKYGGHWMIPDFLTRKMMQKGNTHQKKCHVHGESGVEPWDGVPNFE